MEEIRLLLQALARELSRRGATGVALLGSYARGQSHALSDVDIYAIGEGPGYETRRLDGRLAIIAWRTIDAVRDSFTSLPRCTQAVPGWRAARPLYDPNGVVAYLGAEAEEWLWSLRGP
jgi:predicted nucleotidyltransferase